MEEKSNQKVFRLVQREEHPNSVFMLERPYIIHYIPTSKRKTRKTFAVNFDSEGVVHVAVARCSKKDQFSRKLGRTIAVGRLNTYLQDPFRRSHADSFFPEDYLGHSYESLSSKFSIPKDVIEYIMNVKKKFLDYVQLQEKNTVTSGGNASSN